MMNFGLVLAFSAEKSYIEMAGAMPMSTETRLSSAPSVSAIQAPKENPAVHSSLPG